jgi:hypothetical protein
VKLVVLQPGYFPWLGYFEQMSCADVFVHYDDVQYDKGGWRNRNRIRTPEGWKWLSVPVRIGGKLGAPINAVEVDPRSRWQRQHWGTLLQHYRAAAHWEAAAADLEAFFSGSYERIVDVALASTRVLAERLGIHTETVRSSELPAVPPGSDPTARLVALCKHFGATEYYSGAAAAAYLDPRPFQEIGVRVEFQDYRHPSFQQVYEGFESHLSALDLVLNLGPASRDFLLGDR